MRKMFLYLILSGCLCTATKAQDIGRIVGQVKDETGEGMPGVNVWIEAVEGGSATDINGRFQIENLSTGSYVLRITYLSYETQEISLRVRAGETTEVSVDLAPEAEELEEVKVLTERLEDNEYAITDLRRKSLHLLEGLSVAQMKRLGDNDLGKAVGRITGVTIEDGQYVYVRGLGDRYSKTFVNGASIPGLDPDRNSVHMDLFPTHLVDNVIVYKTFSAQLPGDFTGGYMDISTKSVPDGAVFHISNSLGYNANANLNSNYLTYTGSSTDWLGMDNGFRARPSILQTPLPDISQAEQDEEAAQRLLRATRAFSSQEMTPYRKAMPPNYRHLLSFGNRHHLFDRPLGYMLTLSYQRGFSSYSSGLSGVYKQRGSSSLALTPLLDLEDSRSGEDVLWGAFLSAGYHVSPKHKLTLGLMHNQKGNKTARMQQGFKPENDPDLRYYTQGLWYTQKGISTAQLKGLHKLDSEDRLSLDWTAAHTFSRIYQPDLRFFTYGHYGPRKDGEILYHVQPALGQLPTRYFRDMSEHMSDFRLHLTKSLTSKAQLKAGAAATRQQRRFDEDQYRYSDSQVGILPQGDPNAYIAADNLWTSDNQEGTYLVDATIAANNYEAIQQVWAGYLLWEQPLLREQLTLSVGLRYEGTQMSLESQDLTKGEANLQLHDMLPSLQLNYKAIEERLVLRTAYGRTIARPSFRELAPFASFDFIGDYILVGNSSLKRSRIHNLDLSAEYYPRPGELFTLGVFYKYFQDPIERTFNIEAPTSELTFRNVPKAQVLGLEAGLKKRLDELSGGFLSPFSVGANFTWVHSWVQIDREELQLIRAYDPSAKSRRAMYGQSPYSTNAFLQYADKKGFEGAISYNVFGKRISIIAPGAPSVYELPRHGLDANIGKRFGRYWKARVSLRNILDADFRFAQDFQSATYFVQRYRQGRTLSLSLSYTIE